ncbi:MAG: hypothetical protein WC378_00130 [Opitutaceae bacterium]|jgi:hypothetical protein
MKINGLPPGMVPLLGQQQHQPTEEQMVLATYRSLYLGLIPVVATRLMDRETLADPLMPKDQQDDVASEIARIAEEIADAAMHRLGYDIQHRT